MAHKTPPDVVSLVAVLKDGGVVTIDGHTWSVQSAHSELDLPLDLADPRDNEDDDDWMQRQVAWYESIEKASSENTSGVILIAALCELAGVRIRRP